MNKANRAEKLHREYILRTGKKALDSSKGSIYEDDVRKTMKKHYKKAGVGKPKGTPNAGPNPSAKKVSKKKK